VMKDAGGSPHPRPRWGSKIHKANKTGRIDKQLIKQERLAESAISLASSLKDTLGLHKATILGDPQPAVRGMSGQVTKETTLQATPLFQGSPLIWDLAILRRDSAQFRALKSPEGTLSVLATDSHSGMSSLTTLVLNKGTSALCPSKYSAISHHHIPINKVDETLGTTMFLMAHRTKPGSPGHCWYLQVGVNFHDDHYAKTTMLLGLSALMDILPPGVIDGFGLHPLYEHSSLPPLTSNKVKEGFLGSAVLAFKYFLVKDKRMGTSAGGGCFCTFSSQVQQ
jgi:hypothetical protein